MTTELSLLALCVGLGFVHIVAASHAASLQRGDFTRQASHYPEVRDA